MEKNLHPNWIKAKKLELNKRILALANKLTWTTMEAQKFGPKKRSMRGMVSGGSRRGMIQHWGQMAIRSIMATRKKIYKLQEELKNL